MEFDSYERYLDFETGILHRISTRIYPAEWFGLGSHFGKSTGLGLIVNTAMFIFGTFSTNGFVPKRARQPLAKRGLGGGAPQPT